MLKKIEEKIKSMGSKQLKKTRVAVSMTADLTKDQKDQIYGMIDFREAHINQIDEGVVCSEIKADEVGLHE